jgi:hypothetical protein
MSKVYPKGEKRLIPLFKLSVIFLDFLFNYLFTFIISLLKDFEDLFNLYNRNNRIGL